MSGSGLGATCRRLFDSGQFILCSRFNSVRDKGLLSRVHCLIITRRYSFVVFSRVSVTISNVSSNKSRQGAVSGLVARLESLIRRANIKVVIVSRLGGADNRGSFRRKKVVSLSSLHNDNALGRLPSTMLTLRHGRRTRSRSREGLVGVHILGGHFTNSAKLTKCLR